MALRPRSFTVSVGVALFVLTGLLAVPFDAEPTQAAEPAELIFPVIGSNHYLDTFGACRGSGCSRTHDGVDIMAPKMTPIVAVDDGVVRYVNWSWTAEGIDPTRCCTMAIEHTDGFESWYIHMNNDTPGTDDGNGWGIADGIVPGVQVYAGQLIGWVGDSGNAESAGSHLHFEYHAPDGTVLNPTPYVDGAQVISAPIGAVTYNVDFTHFTQVVAPSESTLVIDTFGSGISWTAEVKRRMGGVVFTASGTASGTILWSAAGVVAGPYTATVDFGPYGKVEHAIQVGDYEWPFIDDEGSYAVTEIEEMWDRGITEGCDWNLFCPNDLLTRAQLVTLIARSMTETVDWPLHQGSYSDVAPGQWYTGPIEYLVQQGVLPGGGGEFGVHEPATRAMVVDVMMNAIGDTAYPPYQGYFSDVAEAEWFTQKIERAHQLGIALGYPDGTFRPHATLTREEAAAFLMRGL
ncbi:MAG: S-layer homology domain-containing protein [Actinomycetota bacterium]|nr:S-layer homology domain-containing protein [Actinomycetota bacterium]MDK1292641.1 S-layer homology domain-containing protein [Actinomycetota bacterium]